MQTNDKCERWWGKDHTLTNRCKDCGRICEGDLIACRLCGKVFEVPENKHSLRYCGDCRYKYAERAKQYSPQSKVKEYIKQAQEILHELDITIETIILADLIRREESGK